MPDSLGRPSAIASVVTGNLIGFCGVPIDKPLDSVVVDPPHAASKDPPIVIAPEVIARFRKKSRRPIGLNCWLVMA